MDTNEKTNIISKITATLWLILPPFIAGNITHWAASEASGKRVSRRGRIAIVVGSFGICLLVHQLCIEFKVSQNVEYIYIWLECMCVTPLLRLAYHELGEIIKDWVRSLLNNLLNSKLFNNKK